MSEKWCRFQAGSTKAYGLVEGNEVAEVSGSPIRVLHAHRGPPRLGTR